MLLPGGGILIDTPGMRELQLWDTGEAGAGAFADIDALAGGCRFRDCRHQQEPGCAVVRRSRPATLPPGRLESYRKLQDEQAHQARQLDQRAQIDEKRRRRRPGEGAAEAGAEMKDGQVAAVAGHECHPPETVRHSPRSLNAQPRARVSY